MGEAQIGSAFIVAEKRHCVGSEAYTLNSVMQQGTGGGEGGRGGGVKGVDMLIAHCTPYTTEDTSTGQAFKFCEVTTYGAAKHFSMPSTKCNAMRCNAVDMLSE